MFQLFKSKQKNSWWVRKEFLSHFVSLNSNKISNRILKEFLEWLNSNSKFYILFMIKLTCFFLILWFLSIYLSLGFNLFDKIFKIDFVVTSNIFPEIDKNHRKNLEFPEYLSNKLMFLFLDIKADINTQCHGTFYSRQSISRHIL